MTGSTAGPRRVGTDESGFSVETGALGVRVRAWGFWDPSVASDFTRLVLEALRATPGRPQLFIDATALKPQREESQDAVRDLVERAAKLGLLRAEIVVTNAITKMQLARILRESGARTWTMTTPMAPAPVGGGQG